MSFTRNGTSELCFEVPDVIKDIDRMKKLYELFAEALKELESMGVTSGKEYLRNIVFVR